LTAATDQRSDVKKSWGENHVPLNDTDAAALFDNEMD